MAEEQIRVLIDSEQKRRFQIRCLEKGLKMSGVLRDFIENFLENKQPEAEAVKFLRLLASEERPTNTQIAQLGRDTGISEEKLMDICDRVIPPKSKRR
ncbi:MAG: hypothetical protein F6K36_27945 [Symploca sp. SIO3C6]|uniref:CopG family transcriptional regulator n=1 Tax=Symploca sp. SIO1C4 TaxID=2607765 RepID=A0A6B3N9Q4_9CYAN|nr:hypothetical protein [Symploca sp. SIO3C6]NER28233.1 hypothetical protein [Symploca sp. SIO1C4]NET04859.1 hypothetical protein [Symploca sp. SIO2B6]NET51029.1 hypothetical protein [Merismopedia sp. SIO2A8]